MDDLEDVNKDSEDSEKAHEDAIHFQKIKRLKFGVTNVRYQLLEKRN